MYRLLQELPSKLKRLASRKLYVMGDFGFIADFYRWFYEINKFGMIMAMPLAFSSKYYKCFPL